ncbi:hypothetical protein [Burkholderia gladioli]|uniref:hypothetical protein n=1 Tax=Burkholderia gladioli TaxID=28095 RepID=UPI002FE3F6E2
MLIAFEWGLRTVLHVDSFEFMGPTLCAAALTFLIPLTEPKKIMAVSNSKNGILVNARDHQFIPVVWLMVLVGLFAWSASCYYSNKEPGHVFFLLPMHLVIGLGAYFVSIILAMIKEAI